MALSLKQKVALEKVANKPWDYWHPKAVKAYFAFTDRGIKQEVSDEAQAHLDELITNHRHHAITVEMWKEDFRKGILRLDDFLWGEDIPNFILHAMEVYESIDDYLPSRYRAFRRDGFRCLDCKRGIYDGVRLGVKQILLPWEDGFEFSPENLRTVCKECGGL